MYAAIIFKRAHFKVLKDLLTKNAILVVNKYDLVQGKLNKKFKKYEHVFI